MESRFKDFLGARCFRWRILVVIPQTDEALAHASIIATGFISWYLVDKDSLDALALWQADADILVVRGQISE